MDRTLSEVVDLTGAKRRSVQLWADAGILVPLADTDAAGTGVPRRFPLDEGRIAKLLVPIAGLGATKGGLKAFAALLRKHLTLPAGRERTHLAKTIERAARGQGANYLLFADRP